MPPLGSGLSPSLLNFSSKTALNISSLIQHAVSVCNARDYLAVFPTDVLEVFLFLRLEGFASEVEFSTTTFDIFGKLTSFCNV